MRTFTNAGIACGHPQFASEMTVVEKDQNTSERAINRALMHVALAWGFDPEQVRHNPVFWHGGSLNYYDPVSHREQVFEYLKDRGILSSGFNGAYKLNCTLDELNAAADSDYDRGVDFGIVVGLLVSQLYYQHSELEEPSQLVTPSSRSVEILEHLSYLGYLTSIQADNNDRGYRWTNKAEPMLKAQHLL